MKKVYLAAAALFLMVCSQVVAAEIKLAGGGSAIATFFAPFAESYEEFSHNTLTMTSVTPAKGLADLDKGLVDVSVAALSLKDVVMMAERDGVKVDPSTLRSILLDINWLLVYVHKTNPVKVLSRQQLKDIFTGKIINWKELGWHDQPITVVWGKETPGQNFTFTWEVLDGMKVGGKVVEATDYADIRLKLMEDPNAIGIDPLSFKTGALRTPKTPIITTPIIAITKGDPSPKVEGMLDYMLTLKKKLY